MLMSLNLSSRRFCEQRRKNRLQSLRTVSCPTTCIRSSKVSPTNPICGDSSRKQQYSGYYYSNVHGAARLWQRYGFEHVLRDDEVTLVVAKCILANPVRAGLVNRVENYPFVGLCLCAWRVARGVRVRLKPDSTGLGPAKAGHYRD